MVRDRSSVQRREGAVGRIDDDFEGIADSPGRPPESL
jgi:hypothetical protein